MRRQALVLGLLLGAVLVVSVLTVPWDVLPGGQPHVDVARDFTPAQVARERAYHAALRPPAYTSLAVSVLVAAVLGLSSAGARLVGRLPGPWWVRVPTATVVVVLIGRLVTLPLDARSEVVQRRYGLSTRDWAGWIDDLLRGLGVQVLTTSLVLLVLIGLARRTARWWAWGALAAALLTVAGSFVYPLVVEPAFNRFSYLPAGPLRSDLLALAARDHVPVRDVLVADASRRTTALNAYVSGFGSTRRIVLDDTLLKRSPPREIELVIAHELGHAKRQDVLHGTLIGAFGAAAGICALSLVLPVLLPKARVPSVGDPAVVPLVLLLVTVAPLLLLPLTNVVSRHIEARADVHALNLTGDVPTFIASEQRLSVVNLSDLAPGTLVYGLFFDHPSGPQRIAIARAWQQLHP